MLSKFQIRFCSVVFLLSTIFFGAVAAHAGPFSLHKGLQIKRAYTDKYGFDAEEINTIIGLNKEWYEIAYSDTRGIVTNRRVLMADSRAARTYLIGFDRRVPLMVRGTTSLGISNDILRELRATGQARVALMHDVALNSINGVLTMVRPNIKLPVLIENQVVNMPAVHVKGVFQQGNRSGTGDFYFLNDKNRPVLIQYVINFSWENKPRTVRTIHVSAGRSQYAAMLQTLKTIGKLDIYGIHFAFDKATIRKETKGLISDIAKTLKVNPRWTLEIRGHTDSIGGAKYNAKLSMQRANSVKARLVQRYGIKASRLRTSGAGATESKATNATLQGRAINRRVELKRTDR
jgi:outer membrane protein OmpA-like peptidoglycan-associated protein